MKNFVYDVPTQIYFGQNALDHLAEVTPKYGTKALLVYGGGSVKSNGIFDAVTSRLTIPFVELSGVEPNPRLDTVKRGIEIVRSSGADMVLAVGGGSVIDCAKAIALGVFYNGDPWDFIENPNKMPDKSLPVLTVLTLSATGSEMNGNFVITDWDNSEKQGAYSQFVIPKVSFMNPEFTFTVNAYQTACGTADIMSHIFEVYFDPNREAFVTDRLCEALLSTCIQYGKRAIDNPTDYEARSNLMWAGTLAINSLLKKGKSDVNWAVHGMEHQLSACYDIAHGAGLAVLTPAWMKFALNNTTKEKFAEFGRNVWQIPDTDDRVAALLGIEKTAEFFRSLGLPTTMRDCGIDTDERFTEMAEKAVVNSGTRYAYVPMDVADVLSVYHACF